MHPLKLILSGKKDWNGKRDPVAIRARRSYLRANDPSKIALLSNYVREARSGRIDLARELAWPIYDELHMGGGVFVTSNPLDLVDIADTPGDDRLIVRQRFEALCLADLAMAMYELESVDSMDRVEEDLRAMVALLEQRVFSGETRDLDIYTYHDPDDMYRVKSATYDAPGSFAPLIERKHNSLSRITKEGTVARFDVRPKDRFRTVIKLLRQIASPKAGQDPYLVKDRCGFKFVVQDVDAARKIAEELYWFLTASGATVKEDGDNLTVETGLPADVTNARSSSKYRKKQFAVHWHNRWYEIQIVAFPDYYSAQYALDEENHMIYKLRQGTKDMLPLLYPGAIYLEEQTWESPTLQELLYERQIENLGWPLRLKNGKR